MVISKVILLGLLLTVTTPPPLLESGEGGGVSAEAVSSHLKGSDSASLCISISRSTPRTRMSLC